MLHVPFLMATDRSCDRRCGGDERGDRDLRGTTAAEQCLQCDRDCTSVTCVPRALAPGAVAFP
jgi:hypothetical protein